MSLEQCYVPVSQRDFLGFGAAAGLAVECAPMASHVVAEDAALKWDLY